MFLRLMVGYVQVLIRTSTFTALVKAPDTAPLLTRRCTYVPEDFHPESFGDTGIDLYLSGLASLILRAAAIASLQCVRIDMCGRWWPTFYLGNCHAVAPVSSISLRRWRMASRSAAAASSRTALGFVCCVLYQLVHFSLDRGGQLVCGMNLQPAVSGR